MNAYKNLNKLLDVIRSSGPGTTEKTAVRMVENMIYQVATSQAHRDETDRDQTILLIQAVDQLVRELLGSDAFQENERIQKAYSQLREAPAALVFERGLQRLKEVRDEVWNEIG